MAKHVQKINWAMVFVAPPVILGIVAGLWLAVTAAYENTRLAQATDQILGIVDSARDLSVNPNANANEATQSLMDRLVQFKNMQMVALPGRDKKVLLNPWGNAVNVSIIPPQQVVRIETPLRAHYCRRLLHFYGQTPGALGIQDVSLQDEGMSNKSLRSMPDLANPQKREEPFEETMISTACGQGERTTLILTFYLRR